jgi:hypothetical protein
VLGFFIFFIVPQYCIYLLRFLESLSRKRREVADSVSSAPRLVQSYSVPGGMSGSQGTTQAQVLVSGPAQIPAAQTIIVPATPVGGGLPIVPQAPSNTQGSSVERSKSLHEIPRQRTTVGNTPLKDKSPGNLFYKLLDGVARGETWSRYTKKKKHNKNKLNIFLYC